MTGRAARLVTALPIVLLVALAVACGQPLESARGLVVTIDSPSLGRVDGFELRTDEGDVLDFDTTDLDFRPEFPAAHLPEHMRLADPVRVEYRREGNRRVVVRLADEPR